MTLTAIGVGVERRLSGSAIALQGAVMLMDVMPEMCRRLPTLMTAIGACKGPRVLERHGNQDNQEKKSTHGA